MFDSCSPTDCNPPGSSLHGIFQARILERVAISFSRGSSQPRDRTQDSCIGRRIFCHWATREALLALHWWREKSPLDSLMSEIKSSVWKWCMFLLPSGQNWSHAHTSKVRQGVEVGRLGRQCSCSLLAWRWCTETPWWALTHSVSDHWLNSHPLHKAGSTLTSTPVTTPALVSPLLTVLVYVWFLVAETVSLLTKSISFFFLCARRWQHISQPSLHIDRCGHKR